MSPKTANIPSFFGILCQFSSVYIDILLVKPIFFWKLGLCTTKLKQTYGWIVNCMLSIIFTHIWSQNMLCSLNTVICTPVGPSHAASVEPLAYSQNVASVNLFYRYYFGSTSLFSREVYSLFWQIAWFFCNCS